MFDVGFWEVFLILILALLVIGPERLPGAARSLGRWVVKIRRYVEGVKVEVEQEFDVSELKRVLSDQRDQINDLQQQVSSSMNVAALSKAVNLSGDDDDPSLASSDEIIVDEIVDDPTEKTIKDSANKE